MEGGEDIRSTAEEDAATEAAILTHLLAMHPARLSVSELLREIAADPGDFAERDAVERGVRDLATAGLLRRTGDVVEPSRAALRFAELLG